MKSRILCITAGQRAGTTALRGALAATGKFTNFGEIFQETNNSGAGYAQYCEYNKLLASDINTNEKTDQHLQSYIDFIIEKAGNKLPLIDIKFNSWLAIPAPWRYIHQCPYFMDHLISRNTAFIIIRRENLVDQVLSEQIARSIDRWHNIEDSENPQGFEADAELAQHQAQLIVQSEQFLIDSLRGKLCTIFVTYENLYHDGEVNREVLKLLKDQFGIETTPPISPKFHKNAGDKKKIISNYKEIKTLIDQVLSKLPRHDIPNASLI